MPEKRTKERARRARRQGKAPTTQAGAFVREEMEHVRRGEHGVKSKKQAIAIGLNKARRAGVKVPRKDGAAKADGRARTSAPKRAAKKRTAKRK